MDKKLIISPSRNKWVPVIELHAQDLNLSWMQISEQTGISYHTIRYWTRQPEFMTACYDHYMQTHGNKAQYVVEALYHEALEGNVRAIELYLKHTGKYTEKKVHEISPGEKFMNFVKGRETSETPNSIEEAEIVQNPMLEVQSKVHDKVHEPNKVHPTIKEEDKSLEKTKKKFKKYKVNKERRNALLRLKRRAKRVGLASMPTGRPSKTEKAKWIVKLEKLEEEKGIKPPSP